MLQRTLELLRGMFVVIKMVETFHSEGFQQGLLMIRVILSVYTEREGCSR